MSNEIKNDQEPNRTEVDWGKSLSESKDMPDFDMSPIEQIESWLKGAFAFMGPERIKAAVEKIKEMRQSDNPPEDKPPQT